jgi:hypothetical protein
MMRVPNLKAGRSRRVLASNNPVNRVDFTGLQPLAPPTALQSLTQPSPGSINFVNGPGYWSWDGYHNAPGITPHTISNASAFSDASSADFVNALETSDIFVYTGHNQVEKSKPIRLSDGSFTQEELFKRAKRLPRVVFLNACNTGHDLPEPGEFPETTFIGYDDFVENYPAQRQGVAAADALRSNNPIQNLLGNKLGNVPNLQVVSPVPYR